MQLRENARALLLPLDVLVMAQNVRFDGGIFAKVV
jgi:hypothetical protein